MNEPGPYSKDPRIAKVLDLLVQYATGDYSQRGEISAKGDEIDAIIIGLNTLADETQSSKKITQHFLNRIEKIMEVLLRYTMLDFSETLEVSDEKDEIDAIAIGLNTLVEELQSARASEAMQLQEISERRDQIEIIINNAPNAVLVIDEQGKVVRWNRRAENIFGWTSEEVQNKSVRELILPKKQNSPDFAAVEHFMKTGEGPILNKLVEITAVRKNNDEFPIELAISAVKAGGKFLFIAFINDISQRKKAENELITANHELENSNKELEAFTYSVSHDLRAPLRAISGYSQLLIERAGSGLDDQSKRFLESIGSNTKRMGRLIDDLLSLSRFSRAELKKTTVDMDEVVTSVIAELAKSDDHSKVEFRIHPMPKARADYNLIVQVYINLISNAVKYSSLKEKPFVEIGCTEEKGKNIYYVKDNGSGFDMEFYNKLFGVFQRLHDASEFEGTGVGLAIVKRIITKHRGQIWAESIQGEGSQFYFTLK